MARTSLQTGFKKIVIPKASDLIIEQLRTLIINGDLNPGDRLPSENQLAQLFDVKRGRVREALRRLEQYGVVRTSPQSGTYINSFGKKTLNGIMRNLEQTDGGDYPSLIDTRTILERRAAELAAEHIQTHQEGELRTLHEQLKADIKAGGRAMDENLAFHLKIAECSGSPYLVSQLTILIPEVMALALEFDRKLGVRAERFEKVEKEHESIVEAIASGLTEEAARLMDAHIRRGMNMLENLGIADGESE